MADSTHGAAASAAARSKSPVAALVRERGEPLIDGLDRHFPGAREHAEATGSYAFAVAVELGGDRGRAELVREAAKLHDVGKVYVPAEVLASTPEGLDDDARTQLEGHHEAGFRLAQGAGIPADACGWILRVRERFDGSGPERLAGGAIPVESRIARAACACDRALCAAAQAATPRQRRGAAIDMLRETAGAELDPDISAALVRVLGQTAAD